MRNIILVLALVGIVSSKGFLENQIEKYFDTQSQYDHTKASTLFHYTKIVKCSLDVYNYIILGHQNLELWSLLRLAPRHDRCAILL